MLALPLCAQDRIQGDSSKTRFLPTGIRIGTDLLAIGKSQYVNYFRGWEVNVDTDINRRYYVTADYGRWATNYELGNGVYVSNGGYFRVGVDINFLLKDPDRNMFFLGFRRGHSNYWDYTEFTNSDPNFGSVYMVSENPNAIANWNEMTAGLRVKVWKFIWLGATGRVKFGLDTKRTDQLASYDVPGYGKTFKNNWWGINYQLFVRIPVREDKKPSLLSK